MFREFRLVVKKLVEQGQGYQRAEHDQTAAPVDQVSFLFSHISACRFRILFGEQKEGNTGQGYKKNDGRDEMDDCGQIKPA